MSLWAETQQNIELLYSKDAVFNFQQGHYFSAITGLETAQHLGKAHYTKKNIELLLADIQLAYGMLDTARNTFEKHPTTSPLEILDRNQAWWTIAETYYARGDVEPTLQILLDIKGALSPLETNDNKNLLTIKLLAQQKRTVEAMELFNSWKRGQHGDVVWKYNAAIFLLENQHKKRGIRLLEEFSRDKTARRGSVGLALKNETNLLLAKLHYNDSDYHEAARYSLKIWEESFYFNHAQLILGEAVYQQRKYHEAITEWQRMDTRILDESVQDALLKIPQVYLSLKEESTAEQAYKKAIKELKRGKKQLLLLRQSIKNSSVTEILVQKKSLPENSLYLLDELSQKSIPLLIQIYTQTLKLEKNLQDWKNNIKTLEKSEASINNVEMEMRIHHRFDSLKQRIKKINQQAIDIKNRVAIAVDTTLLDAISIKERRLNSNLGRAWYELAALHDRQMTLKEVHQ